MEQKSTTALISAFSRAYHSENNNVKIFNDIIARQLFSDEEYNQISKHMTSGINFFNPSFKGTSKDALRFIVDTQLSPTPLGRQVFAEKALQTAVNIGAKQYIILGSGYDTFAFRQPDWAKKLEIFELDRAAVLEDKKNRLCTLMTPNNIHYINCNLASENPLGKLIACNAFSKNKTSFCSILGIIYYLSNKSFSNILCVLNEILSEGSSIVFDYPTSENCKRQKKQELLAKEAKEDMLESYFYSEIEALLSDNGFLIYEHLSGDEMTKEYFNQYNLNNPIHTITAFENISYCLAVKK